MPGTPPWPGLLLPAPLAGGGAEGPWAERSASTGGPGGRVGGLPLPAGGCCGGVEAPERGAVEASLPCRRCLLSGQTGDASWWSVACSLLLPVACCCGRGAVEGRTILCAVMQAGKGYVVAAGSSEGTGTFKNGSMGFRYFVRTCP